jgi:recombination protein RecT
VNQIATRSNVEAVCTTISRPDFKDRIKSALPPGIDPGRFQRVVLTAIQQNPTLADGDRNQLYNQCLRAAADGLVPDGREGAFVVMGGKLTWMPMVGGIIKRLATAGINIDAQLVYENDEFEQTLGDDAAIHHKAPKLGVSRGKEIGAYAIARLPNGMVMREVMDRDQIEQVRKVSRSGASGPWNAWWGEMARKTVLRRLAKRLPILDPAIAETLTRDDEMYDLNGDDAPAATTTPAQPAGPRRPRGLDTVAAAAQTEPEAGAIEGEVMPAGDEPDHSRSPDDGDF